MGFVLGRKPGNKALYFSVWKGCSRRWKVPRVCGGCGCGVRTRLVPPLCSATSNCSCVRSSMRFLKLWLEIALEWLRQGCLDSLEVHSEVFNALAAVCQNDHEHLPYQIREEQHCLWSILSCLLTGMHPPFEVFLNLEVFLLNRCRRPELHSCCQHMTAQEKPTDSWICLDRVGATRHSATRSPKNHSFFQYQKIISSSKGGEYQEGDYQNRAKSDIHTPDNFCS